MKGNKMGREGRKTMDLLGTTPIPVIFLGTWVWLLTVQALHFTTKIHEPTPTYIGTSTKKGN